MVKPDPQPQGKEEGQGALTGSQDTSCHQPVYSVLGTTDSAPSLRKVFHGYQTTLDAQQL